MPIFNAISKFNLPGGIDLLLHLQSPSLLYSSGGVARSLIPLHNKYVCPEPPTHS